MLLSSSSHTRPPATRKIHPTSIDRYWLESRFVADVLDNDEQQAWERYGDLKPGRHRPSQVLNQRHLSTSSPRRALDSHACTTSHDCEVTLVYDTGYSGGVARQAHVHAVLAGVVGTEVEARLTDSSWPAAANTIWSQR